MKIKILHPIKGFSYFGGEVTDVSDKLGSEMVANNHAMMIPDVVDDREIEVKTAVVKKKETIKRRKK